MLVPLGDVLVQPQWSGPPLGPLPLAHRIQLALDLVHRLFLLLARDELLLLGKDGLGRVALFRFADFAPFVVVATRGRRGRRRCGRSGPCLLAAFRCLLGKLDWTRLVNGVEDAGLEDSAAGCWLADAGTAARGTLEAEKVDAEKLDLAFGFCASAAGFAAETDPRGDAFEAKAEKGEAPEE